MDEFDIIEQRLRDNGKGVLLKLTERVKLLESKRPWIVAAGVLAAAIAAFSRIDPSGSMGLIMAICGGIGAAASGLLVAIFDYRKLELGTELKDAEEIAEKAIALGRAKARDSVDARADEAAARAAIDARIAHRKSLMRALTLMNEVAERLKIGISVLTVIEAMLDAALSDILDAFGFGPGEHWTISVFSLEGSGKDEAMHRRVSRWWDKNLAQTDDRVWRVGDGYTGYAWLNKKDVIIHDSSDADVVGRFRVSQKNARSTDTEIFMSVAAIPIRIGKDENICGVLVVTSNRPDQFLDNPTDPRAQNADLIRQIEAIIAVQIALRRDSSQGVFNLPSSPTM